MAFTFFFRDSGTLQQAVDQMIPATMGRSRVRIWDAGCAMGPEPYTLGILLAEKMGTFAYKNLRIDCSDIDESGHFGEIIRDGIYPYNELNRIPTDIFEKYFSEVEEGQYRIAEKIRSRMEYQQHDLLSLKPIGGGYSLIVCKNVLLHFSYEMRIKVIRMFHQSLAPDGFFLTEQTQKIPEEIETLFERKSSNCQLFQKKESNS